MSETKNNNDIIKLGLGLGFRLALPLVVFAIGGRLLDKYFGTSPFLILSGILISLLLSFYLVYRELRQVLKNETNNDKN